jgi:hypothetical protein
MVVAEFVQVFLKFVTNLVYQSIKKLVCLRRRNIKILGSLHYLSTT